MDSQFFELIRVAIGNQAYLSRKPKMKEWQELYAMAKKQCLVGICFAGVQKLTINHSSLTENLSESLRLQWMGMAAKIQQRNEGMNKRCAELHQRLKSDGFDNCILKGQSVAQYYNEDLKTLRQSGDIDVWIAASIAESVKYARTFNNETSFDFLHVNLDIFPDADVELHYRPGCMYNLSSNLKFQHWLKQFEISRYSKNILGFATPSVEFDAIYILQHAYRHLINGGIGLRQMMDYYFVLREVQTIGDRGVKNPEYQDLLKTFGMMRFAKAVMWVMQEVFGLSKDYMICESDENEGRFLLNEIMMGGNFGHYDSRKEKHKVNESKWGILLRKIKTNMHLLTHYPSEVLSAPIYFVWHYFWKRKQLK